jgi:GntR family transcriptional regulator
VPGLDTSSPLPKYYQLKEILRGMIEREDLQRGELIPPERELCEEYGISRMTARQAIVELVNEGILYREQGRGTFVAGEKVKQEAERLASFTEDMAGRGHETTSSVLDAEPVRAGPVVARLLGIEETDEVVRVRRVRHADGEPMALETSHLLYGVASGLLTLDLSSRSIYGELRAGGLNIAWAEQSYEATLINDFEAKHLGVPQGSPALLIERVTHDGRDLAFEYVKSTYRGDRYRITTTLRP